MSDKPQKSEDATEKPSVTLPGKVEKIIPGVVPTMPDKAQIAVEGADHLYKEIRVENTLEDENGKPVSLKPGAEVQVTIEAEKQATEPKKSSDSADQRLVKSDFGTQGQPSSRGRELGIALVALKAVPTFRFPESCQNQACGSLT